MSDTEKMSDAIMEMAKSYGLGTPESRAIITALEHARIVVGLHTPEPEWPGVVKHDIKSKVRNIRGQQYGGDSTGMFAEFGKNDEGKATIRLTGQYGGYKDVNISFTEGATAIYDSYNFDYLGTITKITEKTVTIQPNHGARVHRLDLATFANRNCDFDIEKSHKRRMEWSD